MGHGGMIARRAETREDNGRRACVQQQVQPFVFQTQTRGGRLSWSSAGTSARQVPSTTLAIFGTRQYVRCFAFLYAPPHHARPQKTPLAPTPSLRPILCSHLHLLYHV